MHNSLVHGNAWRIASIICKSLSCVLRNLSLTLERKCLGSIAIEITMYLSMPRMCCTQVSNGLRRYSVPKISVLLLMLYILAGIGCKKLLSYWLLFHEFNYYLGWSLFNYNLFFEVEANSGRIYTDLWSGEVNITKVTILFFCCLSQMLSMTATIEESVVYL